MRILLVEDNPVDRIFVTQALKQVEGFEHNLVLCDTLEKALEHVTTSRFDVILLDLWLPDSEGLESCRMVVAAAQNTPVVVMTGANDLTLATESIRSGAQDYLVKGVFPGAAIARVLEYAVDRFRFQRELARRENRFQEVVSHLPAIIWTTNSQLEITSAMGAGLSLLNIDPQQTVGKKLQDYLQGTSQPGPAMKAHQQALNGRSASLETEWQGRIFEVKIDALHESKTKISGTVGVALDVTERRSLHREINFARLVQEALLPDEHPCLAGFDIFGGSYPARQTCGDWFDYLKFTDGSLGLAVGDVSGKGFGPAILSATMAAYLEVLAEHHSDVQHILNSCNEMICRRTLDGQFVILALARLQLGTRKLTYCGAGDEILIIGQDGLLKHTIPASGIPIGLIDDTRYQSPGEVLLESGDILLMLTDGFWEAIESNGEQFGVHRIIKTVAEHRHASACEIFHELWQAVSSFAVGLHQHDDMTGIIAKVLDD